MRLATFVATLVADSRPMGAVLPGRFGHAGGDDHGNIRNFMENGWEGVDFYNGISLTKKNTGENEWDWDAESWIP